MYEIKSIDHFGRGITYIDDKITFVNNALPGEIVELILTKQSKKYNEASILKYIKKANCRCEVNCKYYSDCGGCNIMHLNYNDQLNFKENKIKEIISKYVDKNIKVNSIIKCDNINNYRNKVSFQVNKNIGFYKNNSYELIPIEKCLISNNLINNAIKYLNMLNLESIDKIICRTASNKLMIIIETNNTNIDINPLKEIADSIYIKTKSEFSHIYKDKYIYEKIGDYKYIISPDSFFQININVCEKLYSKIKEYVGTNKNVLDLYCGTGSIGIFVSKDNNVVGIEKNKYAIADANKNKELNNVKNIRFICGDSGKELNHINFIPDIIIVDPPRNGLNKETLNNILKINSKKIIYVSCDPMTLTRDLNILKNKYNIINVTPFDMFPNTYHCESVCILERK